MECHEARRHLMLYLDSEGDPQLHFGISDHLETCPACAEWFSKQQRFERQLAERLGECAASAVRWDRMLAGAGLPVARAGRRRWIVYGIVAVAAGVVIAAALHAAFWTAQRTELAAIAAAWHDDWTGGSLEPDLVSESDREVDDYLKRQVPFRVHCPPRKDVEFHVAGAGVRAARDQTAAYIVGRVGGAPVSILVLARDSLDVFPADRSLLSRGAGRHRCRSRGYQLVSGTTQDNVVVVIGAVSSESLEKVLNAYGSYHEPRG